MSNDSPVPLSDPEPAPFATSSAMNWWPVAVVVALGLIVTALASYISYQRLLTLEAAKVGALGTALGIGGLIAAALGFGLTLWQLARTARSADAAAKAVWNVKRDYGSFDAMAELSAAKGLGEAIRTSLEARDRSSAKTRYDRLRESLVRLSSGEHALRDQVSQEFKDKAANAVVSLSTLREITDDTQLPWNDMIQSLEELDSFLISVSQALRNSVRG